MESLNSLYKIQLQSASRNAQINEEVENNIKLRANAIANYKSIFFERSIWWYVICNE
jgi:hypothetical protein